MRPIEKKPVSCKVQNQPRQMHSLISNLLFATKIVYSLNYYIQDLKPIATYFSGEELNQRTNGPVNAHLISWPSKAQNIQNLENIW